MILILALIVAIVLMVLRIVFKLYLLGYLAVTILALTAIIWAIAMLL